MDTVGSLVDKLATVNNKMFWNQEFLYEIKKMSKDEFIHKYLINETELEDLYNKLCKVVDLNLQRQSLILEHDKMLVGMVIDIVSSVDNANKYIVDQHKTLKTE
jgi:hypothetical protein